MRDRQRIVSAASLVFGAYVASRLLGWLREVVIAAEFGTSRTYDAYLLAFIIPDLLVSLVVAGALSSAFIPVLSGYIAKGEEAEANHISLSLLNVGGLVLGLGAVVLFAMAPFFVAIVAPGFSPAERTLTTNLTRIMLLQPVFLGLGGFVLGILNSYRRFSGPALAPLAYNAAVIISALVAPLAGPRAVQVLAFGVVAGGLLHLAVQVPSLLRTGWRWHPRIDLRHSGVREVGRLMIPISLGLAATQVNLVVDRVLASFLPYGRIAALGYANYVVQVPLGTFAAALAMVIFPYLAQDAALRRFDALREKAALALRLNLFVQVPASVGLAVLALPVVEFVFQRGKFNSGSSRETALALVFFCFGLFAQAGVAIMVRVFYALKEVGVPLKAALATIVVNVALNLVLVGPMQQSGLALGTSLAAVFNLVLLLVVASRRLEGLEGPALRRTAIRALAASAVMAVAANRAYVFLAFHSSHQVSKAGALAAGILVGAVVYVLVASLLRMGEARVLLNLLRRRPGALDEA